MGRQTEVFYCNVKILLHHQPNSFHDELSREADEGVSARGKFLHRPQLLVLMTEKETINWTRQNGYLHRWLLPLNGLQDGTPYAGRPVGNSPDFMPLDNSLNRDIFHSLLMHSVVSCCILDGEETDKEERNM